MNEDPLRRLRREYTEYYNDERVHTLIGDVAEAFRCAVPDSQRACSFRMMTSSCTSLVSCTK